MAVHHPFFVVITIFFSLLLGLTRAGGAAAGTPSSASHHRRQAQGIVSSSSTSQCGDSQCYYSSLTSNYAGCFHITSRECTVLLQEQLELSPSTSTDTPPPTPNPITQMVQSEIPILLRLLNVPEDYILSPSDRAKILSKMWALLNEELDDSWEIMNVEFPGQYMGARRLQSLLRGGSRRRLTNSLYIPVVVTVRGREVMSGMSLDFILQAFRNKLNMLLMYIKSLDTDAFRNLQLSELSVDKLDLDDVAEGVGGPTVIIQSTDSNSSTMTETNSSTETKISVGTQSTGAPSTGAPFWVWIIVAAVCIPLIICLLLCMCRAGWCVCCTEWLSCFKRKRDTKEDNELQKQLAIERWSQQPVKKRRDRDSVDNLVSVARYDDSDRGRISRERDVRRKHRRRRGDHGRRRHGDRRHSDRRNHERDRSPRARPVAKRSLSMIEKEIALAQLKIIEGGSEAETKYDEPVVAALPVSLLPASLPTQNQGKDPSVAADYQNAVVVYDDEQVRFTMEPEGPKIDDVPKPESTAVVLFTPLKEPEGDIVETPRRKSSRYYRHEKDELYVCSPDDLPPDIREKTANYADRLKESFTFMGTDSRRNDDDFSEIPSIVQEKTTNHSDKPQDRRRSSRRNRRSYSDRLKESFTFMRTDKRRNDDNNLEDHDGVQATPGAEESGSEEKEKEEGGKKEE